MRATLCPSHSKWASQISTPPAETVCNSTTLPVGNFSLVLHLNLVRSYHLFLLKGCLFEWSCCYCDFVGSFCPNPIWDLYSLDDLVWFQFSHFILIKTFFKEPLPKCWGLAWKNTEHGRKQKETEQKTVVIKCIFLHCDMADTFKTLE